MRTKHDARDVGRERSGNTALQEMGTREACALPPLLTGQGRASPACCRRRRGGGAHLELRTAQARHHGRGRMLSCAERRHAMLGSCHRRHGDGGGIAESLCKGYGRGSPARCHQRGGMCSALARDYSPTRPLPTRDGAFCTASARAGGPAAPR